MPRARIFCLWEGRRGGRWTGRRWVAGGTCEELAGRATQEERHARSAKKEKRAVFFFLRKDQRAFACPPGGSRGRGARLLRPCGIGTAAKTVRADAAQGGPATQLIEGCGLWPPFQLIQLIDLRYLCESAEREERMDVCFLLTLYI